MIDASEAAITGVPGFVPDKRQFRVNAPTGVPFVAPAAMDITRQGLVIDVEPGEVQALGGSTATDPILEDMLARSRRDIERYPSSARARANLVLCDT